MVGIIRKCNSNDFDAIYSIINDAAEAYKGVIPNDCWKEPYMAKEELQHEIDNGVMFWGYEENVEIFGIMGLQDVKDIVLIRHAYVRTGKRNQGIGGKLLRYLQKQTTKPVLMGTWKDALWAIKFYEKHGFRLVTEQEKDGLLRKYWSLPDRQIETSVVLADQKWLRANSKHSFSV